MSSYRLLAYGFRVYFTRLTGVLFTFPSRYLYTIGHAVVFSLGRWASQFPTGFHEPRSTREHYSGSTKHFSYGTVTLSGNAFQHIRLCLGAYPGDFAVSPSKIPRPYTTNASKLPVV
jgi:hypothetical protein